jgi:phospholipid/cholesterol/gamma-HCH transport system substrate-binding protein
MENRAHALAAGVFVLVLCVLLSAAAFWLGGGTLRGLPYDLITETSVAGLNPGAIVRLRGVEVGQIESIGFDPADPRRVRVRALVDPHVRLMADTRATISYQGLSGAAYVELDYPDTASGILQTSATMPARIPMRASGFARLIDASDDLIATFNGTLGRVNALLTPETEEHFTQLVSNLNRAAIGMTQLTRDLRPVAQHVDGVLASGDELMQTLRSTARDADALVLSANAPGGALEAVRYGAVSTGRAAQDVEQALVAETLPRIDVVAERLARSADSLNQLLQQAQSQPQSFIFGPPPPAPGPGEPGFQKAIKK